MRVSPDRSSKVLSEEGFAVKHAADGERGPGGRCGAGEWDLFILDWWLPIDFTPSLAGVFQNRCYRKTARIELVREAETAQSGSVRHAAVDQTEAR